MVLSTSSLQCEKPENITWWQYVSSRFCFCVKELIAFALLGKLQLQFKAHELKNGNIHIVQGKKKILFVPFIRDEMIVKTVNANHKYHWPDCRSLKGTLVLHLRAGQYYCLMKICTWACLPKWGCPSPFVTSYCTTRRRLRTGADLVSLESVQSCINGSVQGFPLVVEFVDKLMVQKSIPKIKYENT